jgi:hypothetical protein
LDFRNNGIPEYFGFANDEISTRDKSITKGLSFL